MDCAVAISLLVLLTCTSAKYSWILCGLMYHAIIRYIQMFSKMHLLCSVIECVDSVDLSKHVSYTYKMSEREKLSLLLMKTM